MLVDMTQLDGVQEPELIRALRRCAGAELALYIVVVASENGDPIPGGIDDGQ